MARGSNAKVEVENKIATAFGENYIGCYDKKLYVWADDGGEKVQIAITLTCPKVPVGQVENGMDFDNMNAAATEGQNFEFKPAEITKEETDNIKKLLAELGL